MSFKIAEAPGNTRWCSCDGSSTYYVGQIVSLVAASKANIGGTVIPLAVPAGAADTTNFQVPFGVVIGTNDKTPVANSTGTYVTGLTTQATQLARTWAFNEGMYSKGDPQPLVLVEEITPLSVLEGNIFNAAIGTAPTVVADADGTDTTGYTTAGLTSACDFTPVASNSTIYCRAGKNAGFYRVTSDTSTTAPAVTVGFPYDVALADTFVRVPLKQGLSSIYIGGPGLYIDCSKTPATNTFQVIVTNLDLSTAGSEKAQFRFCVDHFSYARA